MNAIDKTKKIEITVFPAIEVDYGLRCTNDFLNLDFSDQNPSYVVSNVFPVPYFGSTNINMDLIRFYFNTSVDDVIKELSRMSYRPAHICELLVLCEKFPDIQLERPIAALGSAWEYNGKIKFAYIPGSGILCKPITVHSSSLLYGWDNYFYCAAVRV